MAGRYKFAHQFFQQVQEKAAAPGSEVQEGQHFPLTVVDTVPQTNLISFRTIVYLPLSNSEDNLPDLPSTYPLDREDSSIPIYERHVQCQRWQRYHALHRLSPPVTEEEKTPAYLRGLLARWKYLAEDSRERLILCTQFHLDDTVLHPFASDRDRAMVRLQSTNPGSYLVRPSSVGDAETKDEEGATVPFARVRVVSCRLAENNEIRHVLIAHIFGLGWVNFTGDMEELRAHGFPGLGSGRAVRLYDLFPSAVELIAYLSESHGFDLAAFVCS